jgi:hypothetical protein
MLAAKSTLVAAFWIDDGIESDFFMKGTRECIKLNINFVWFQFFLWGLNKLKARYNMDCSRIF